MKQEVYSRDKGQCCYVGPDGVRCCEKKYLQFDHVLSYAKGGLSEVSNLQLLCPAHNRLKAEQEFGREFIESRKSISTSGNAEPAAAGSSVAATGETSEPRCCESLCSAPARVGPFASRTLRIGSALLRVSLV